MSDGVNVRQHRAINKYMDSTPWAMEPTRLDVLHQVIIDHMAGHNVALEADAAVKTNLVTTSSGSTAVIPIHGTIVKRAYGLSAISGSARTTLDMQQDIQDALDNPKVSGIVLDIDSPGGTVDGTKQLADFVKYADGIKPVVAYANGMMCSAAMWVGSAARHIVAFPTSTVGSIGVIVSHQDRSKAEEAEGVKVTHIYAGKYKSMGNSNEPLSAEGKDYIQSKIDGIYSMFVDDISSNRKLDKDYVLNNLATAATFLGKEAVELKLVDSVGTLEDAILIAQNDGGISMTEQEKVQEQLDQMQVKLDEAMLALASSNEQVTALVSAKEQSDSELATLKAETEAKEKAEAISELFAGTKVSEAFLATMNGMELEAVSVIAGEMSSKQEQVDSVVDEHLEPKGKTTKQDETPVVSTIDEATTFIMNRDKCDVEEATNKMVAEFPNLFDK